MFGLISCLVIFATISLVVVVRRDGLRPFRFVRKRDWFWATVFMLVGTVTMLYSNLGANALGIALFFAWARIMLAYLNLTKRVAPNLQKLMPPPWPPRQPADWGREIQEQHQEALKQFAFQQKLASVSGRPHHGGAPLMPLIPSWDAHYAAEQLQAPLQIRWAQTDTGDWLRVNYGNRMRPPAKGNPLPVFQVMQRADNGEWIWLPIPHDDFAWQQGPSRVDEYPYVDGQGVQRLALRPCGHPGWKEPPALPEDDGVHGVAKPLSDAQLADMNLADSAAGMDQRDMPPAEPPSAEPQTSTTHGSATLLTDEELAALDASREGDPSAP